MKKNHKFVKLSMATMIVFGAIAPSMAMTQNIFAQDDVSVVNYEPIVNDVPNEDVVPVDNDEIAKKIAELMENNPDQFMISENDETTKNDNNIISDNVKDVYVDNDVTIEKVEIKQVENNFAKRIAELMENNPDQYENTNFDGIKKVNNDEIEKKTLELYKGNRIGGTALDLIKQTAENEKAERKVEKNKDNNTNQDSSDLIKKLMPYHPIC